MANERAMRLPLPPFRFLLLASLLLLLPAGRLRGEEAGTPEAPALPPAPETLRVVSYNTYNFMPLSKPQIKSAESRQMVISLLADLRPDIAVLTEVGGQAGADELAALLAKAGAAYPFTTVVVGEDPERNITVIARVAPVEVRHDTESVYNLGGRATRVQRGFAHLLFAWENGYRLHLVGAHLKSKLFDARGQTDMRRYEARLLRYLVDGILRQDAGANILVVGDLNDSPDSSPLNTLINRRVARERQLYDLRPLDGHGLSWTHVQDEADTYSRIDYALASWGLLAEIALDQTFIPQIADALIASDHRPLVITLRPHDRPMPEERPALFERNIRIPPVPASYFHEGPIVGRRKAQRGGD
jgi:endonuclease/exonuclease/phosphatase family metal-dependent hydrolase